MGKARPLTIPAESVEQFGDFVNAASVLNIGGHLNFALQARALLPEDIKSIPAFQILCAEHIREKKALTLQPEDVEVIQALHRVFKHYAKPSQLPLLGQGVHERVVASEKNLSQMLPKEKDSRTP